MALSIPPQTRDEAGAARGALQSGVWHVGSLTYSRLDLRVLFCWLLWGDFAWSLKERSAGPVFQILLKKFDASDLLAGLLMGALPHVIAVILNPIISYYSDRHRGKWGRRIPFLLIPTPVAALAMVGLAFGPKLGEALHQMLGDRSPGLNTATLLSMGVAWLLFELATITANSVFGALINDVVPRPVLGRFFGLFRALSLVAGMIFYFYLIGKAETDYFWVFVGIGAIYGLGVTLMCLNVREGTYPPPEEAKVRRGLIPAPLLQYFKDCFGDRYFLLIFFTISAGWTAFIPINYFNLFFARSIDMPMSDFGRIIALTYAISLLLSYPLGALVDRFHPLRVSFVIMTTYGLFALASGFFITDQASYAIALLGHGVLSGAWMTAVASLGQVLLPKERFAQFASAMGIVTSICTILIAPLTGFLLDCLQHRYQYTYLIGGGIGIGAALLAFFLLGKCSDIGAMEKTKQVA